MLANKAVPPVEHVLPSKQLSYVMQANRWDIMFEQVLIDMFEDATALGIVLEWDADLIWYARTMMANRVIDTHTQRKEIR